MSTLARISWIALAIGCFEPATRFDHHIGQIITNCEGELADSGVLAAGSFVHLTPRFGETLIPEIDAGSLFAATAADGGFCVKVDSPSGTICFSSGRCIAVQVVDPPILTSATVSFGRVPVGRSATRTLVVTNRLSSAVVVESASNSPAFSVRPRQVLIGPDQSFSFMGTFAPARAGLAEATFFFDSNGRRYSTNASGEGGGPQLEVQPFLDAGLITRTPVRASERRRLLILNASDPLPGNGFEPGTITVRTECSSGSPARVSILAPTPIAPGGAAFYDMLIDPVELGVWRSCFAYLRLGVVEYPVELVFKGIEVPPVRLGHPLVFPPDGGLEVELMHDFADPAYLSWPRLEFPDAGLELVTNWTEFILPQFQSLTFFVRQTSANPRLPNSVVIDGNVNPGRFDLRQ